MAMISSKATGSVNRGPVLQDVRSRQRGITASSSIDASPSSPTNALHSRRGRRVATLMASSRPTSAARCAASTSTIGAFAAMHGVLPWTRTAEASIITNRRGGTIAANNASTQSPADDEETAGFEPEVNGGDESVAASHTPTDTTAAGGDVKTRSSPQINQTPASATTDGGAALAPPAVFQAACNLAANKAQQPALTTLVLGFMAGALIGMGALLMTVVGTNTNGLAMSNPGLSQFVKGAVGLPAGLTLVVLTGAELFTGNVFVMISGLLKGTVSTYQLCTNWYLSFVGNLAGSVFIAYLACLAKTVSAPLMINSALTMALHKTSMPFLVAFTKGVLCNWLVCLAVWGAMASKDVAGKILAIFWPISTFVALGFEHSVANMYLIPQGMLLGADVSVQQFLVNNILPVTAGNIVGAGLFVAGVHFIAYGRTNSAAALPTSSK